MPPRRRRPPRPGALSDLPPLLIIRTILLLQLSYYLAALILIGFSSLVLGQRFSLDLILDWRSVRGDVTQGWVLGVCWGLSSFLTVLPLLFLLPRSRLVPDFALTLHFIHLLTTTLYTSSLPTNLLWWLLQFSSVALMITLGVWVGRYREMRPITFGLGANHAGGKNSQARANGSVTGGGSNGQVGGRGGEGRTGDEHVRGGPGRGGKRTGGGPSYEMVPIQESGIEGDENV